jgi:hypothetical protein
VFLEMTGGAADFIDVLPLAESREDPGEEEGPILPARELAEPMLRVRAFDFPISGIGIASAEGSACGNPGVAVGVLSASFPSSN